MLTPQQIQDTSFEKALFGGYDMDSVDDFLEPLTADYVTLYKENSVLKSKMKVLVDKIEEYRANEEALNMAVLSAQKLAVQIENDARTRSAAMIEEAEQQVKARVGGIEAETEKQEKRLADAKAATEKFFEAARALCNTQLRNLDAISSGMTAAQPAAAPASESADVDSAVRSIEESVSKLRPEPPVKMDLSSAMKPAAKPKKNFDSTQTFTL